MKSRSYILLLTTLFVLRIPNMSAQEVKLPASLSAPAAVNAPTSKPGLMPITKSIETPVLSDPANSNKDRIQVILDFWFMQTPGSEGLWVDKVNLWFGENTETNRLIGALFEDDVHRALSGQLNDWRLTPKGRLALILLTDQFPKRIYSEKPQAFASESMAKGLVLEGIQKGDDKKLSPIERAFFYMPLQRFENPDLQNLSVDLYTRLLNDSPEASKPQLEAFLGFAIRNRQIIEHFKRFPNRNRILGRESTPEEMIFLNRKNLLGN